MNLLINIFLFHNSNGNRFPLEVLPGVGETMGVIIRIQLTTGRATKKIVKEFAQMFYQMLKTLTPEYVNPDFNTNIYY